MPTDAHVALWYQRIHAEFLKGTTAADTLEILKRMSEATDAVRYASHRIPSKERCKVPDQAVDTTF